MLKEPNLAKEAGQGLLGIVSAYARGDMGGMANTAMGFLKRATKGEQGYEKSKQTKTSPADVVMWSGSKDTQTSYVTLLFLLLRQKFINRAQARCTDRGPSDRRNVLGIYHRTQEEPAAELRAVA